MMKQMDCNEWTKSYTVQTYSRLCNNEFGIFNKPKMDLALNAKKFKTVEEWNEHFDNIKKKTKEALEAIDLDALQRKDREKSAETQKKMESKQKNVFRYRRADFRQSKAYEKCIMLNREDPSNPRSVGE